MKIQVDRKTNNQALEHSTFQRLCISHVISAKTMCLLYEIFPEIWRDELSFAGSETLFQSINRNMYRQFVEMAYIFTGSFSPYTEIQYFKYLPENNDIQRNFIFKVTLWSKPKIVCN